MQGDPPCDWADFLSPQLRRFPRAYNKVTMRNRLGHGIEGCVARVKFDDDESSFALKIVYGDRPNSWWPLEREARNVAVLEKIQAGIHQSSPEPIHVPAKRTTRLDCLRCLYAFSADGRRSRDFDALPDDSKVAVSESDTRLRKCFGWIRVQGADFMRMNSIIKIDEYARRKGEGSASYLESGAQYYAIVYEYSQLDFFYRIGFHPCQGLHKVNWQGPGILLDFGDYNSPVDPWFEARCAYHKHTTAEYIIDRTKALEESSAEWDRINNLRDQGIGPTEEEKQKREKEKAQSNTARFVEYGYDEHQRYLSYSECKAWDGGNPQTVTNEEILERKLELDPLSQIRINGVEPETVILAWKTYKNQKKKHLAAFGPKTETKEV
ncbi:uncharacterized protein C8A04DRAFT_41003 [Dichotomopilus funicola]|uniref:Uncharacterized protein n=1 Tax=Dichotomopilus funicola TaxID=1934379 RepID=A0AAN6UTS5_9PEZI|nr:hypothetical protein C8A04DRAFT_41003 [Dichotomopilus funicola]